MQPKQFTFVMEQALGHVTFTKNLRLAVEADPTVAVNWLLVNYAAESWPERLPGMRSNWSLRASLKARRAIEAQCSRKGRPELYFFHTQVTSLLSAGWMDGRVPTVISLDATPINYDRVGAAYNHQTGPAALEKFKFWLNRRTFQAATRLVTISEWARRSLVEDYGVDPVKTEVIRYGTDLKFWDSRGKRKVQPEGKIRLLFVGGNFERKGGKLLLDCYRQHFADRCELHLVTKDRVEAGPGVFVYQNIAPNSPQLQSLLHQADIFVLPTEGDCYSFADMEAMAAGLPVVSTRVGAIDELVIDGETGFLIRPKDGQALSEALARLVEDEGLRQRMGARGREIVEANHDASKNGQQLLDMCKSLVEGQPFRHPAEVSHAMN